MLFKWDLRKEYDQSLRKRRQYSRAEGRKLFKSNALRLGCDVEVMMLTFKTKDVYFFAKESEDHRMIELYISKQLVNLHQEGILLMKVKRIDIACDIEEVMEGFNEACYRKLRLQFPMERKYFSMRTLRVYDTKF